MRRFCICVVMFNGPDVQLIFIYYSKIGINTYNITQPHNDHFSRVRDTMNLENRLGELFVKTSVPEIFMLAKETTVI